MDYFAGLDISMEETHVCVVDRDGTVVHEAKTAARRPMRLRFRWHRRRCAGVLCSRRAAWPRPSTMG